MELETQMSLRGKREYFQAIQRRYHRSGKKQKGVILDEFSATTGLDRKYATRLLNEGYRAGRKKPGPAPRYGNDERFLFALRCLWRLSHYACGKLLKAMIPELLKHYERHYEALEEETRQKLFCVSHSTIDRLLRRYRALHGKTLTKPGSMLRTEIPIQGTCWDQSIPGFVEADTVAHCGTSTKGPFISTLTLTDIATQWTENRAIWSRGANDTLSAIEDMKLSLPFELQGFDCDNGSEFLNHHLQRYFQERNIRFTRSRPYRKNDSAHVEQKNWSHVRQLLGYGRFENPELLPVLNELYKTYWNPFKNYFLPCMKLIEKKQVGSKIIRKHDEPKTPYKRVLESPFVSDKKKQELKNFYETLDPFILKREIDKRLQLVRRLASVSYEAWFDSHQQPLSQ